MTEIEKGFRSSPHQNALAAFLDSPTGKELLNHLEIIARPSRAAANSYGDNEDVKFQMAINFVASNERFAFINFIRRLATPLNSKHITQFEPLEPDEDYSPKKDKPKEK